MSGLLSVINKNDNKIANIKEWNKFIIKNLFKVECSKYHNPDKYDDGTIPYVARTTFNNGVIKFVSTDEVLYDGNCIIIGAESAKAFYQESPFITGNKIYRIYATEQSKMNKYIGLFLCTILNKEGEKYSYSNAWVSEKVEKTEISLPTLNGNPNWELIEKIMMDYYKEIEEAVI